ncbi:MAG: TetR/AcrR family transcriptional regulator [Calditrichales bacterium]|nr:TetR/AcrR family transcriptional regulator [Calditrichales bacterium]
MIDRSERKTFILEIAQNLFAKFGLAKTTIDDIAKKARMGKASIYYYFKSKESIFQEVIDKEGRALQDKILVAVNTEKSPQEKMQAYFITRMVALKELINYYSALRDEYLDHYSFVAKARQSFDVFETTLISNILQEGIQSGDFEVENAALAAEAILAALKGFEFQWTIEIPAEQIETNINTLLKILFKGIEKRS